MASFPTIEQFAREVKDQAIKIIEEETGVSFERLVQLACADREGRCVVLNTGYTETAGGKALKQAMYLCSVTNNEVTRYTADAIAEKLVREERFCEAMKARKNDG